METEEAVNTIRFVRGRKPEGIIEHDFERRGLKVEWADSIKTAKDLLAPQHPRERPSSLNLALADGDWTDLIEQVTYISSSYPIVLVSSTCTAELWWDARDYGVEDIVLASLSASRLCEILGHSTGL